MLPVNEPKSFRFSDFELLLRSGELFRNGFNVSINTDNRLMSGVSVGSEYQLVADVFGLSLGDLEVITSNAIEAGFGDYPTRKRLIESVVRPAYAQARAALG